MHGPVQAQLSGIPNPGPRMRSTIGLTTLPLSRQEKMKYHYALDGIKATKNPGTVVTYNTALWRDRVTIVVTKTQQNILHIELKVAINNTKQLCAAEKITQ
jgi:hypothetical protein